MIMEALVSSQLSLLSVCRYGLLAAIFGFAAVACGDGFEPLEPDLDFVAIRIGDAVEWTRLMCVCPCVFSDVPLPNHLGRANPYGLRNRCADRV